jgi:hypothetical protein
VPKGTTTNYAYSRQALNLIDITHRTISVGFPIPWAILKTSDMRMMNSTGSFVYFFTITCAIALFPIRVLSQTLPGHCQPPPPKPVAAEAQTGPATAPPILMQGIGNSSMKITTTSPEAQKSFNQGLSLLHCFWWEEALHSFHEAAQAYKDFLVSWLYADQDLPQMQEARNWLQTRERN